MSDPKQLQEAVERLRFALTDNAIPILFKMPLRIVLDALAEAQREAASWEKVAGQHCADAVKLAQELDEAQRCLRWALWIVAPTGMRCMFCAGCHVMGLTPGGNISINHKSDCPYAAAERAVGSAHD